MQIWDLRTGGIFETLKYDHAVSALQFDTRKIVAATGENGVKVSLGFEQKEWHADVGTDLQPHQHAAFDTHDERPYEASGETTLYGSISCLWCTRLDGEDLGSVILYLYSRLA